MWTVGLLAVALTERPVTTFEILSARNRLDVFGVDAMTNATEMVELESSGDRADEMLKCPPMSREIASAIVEHAVPVVRTPSGPEPAVAAEFDLCFKPFNGRSSLGGHVGLLHRRTRDRGAGIIRVPVLSHRATP